MYDWANSGMLLLVVTTIFPIFFSQFVSDDPVRATGRFTLATTIGLAAIALAAPFLGTLADQTAAKLRFLGGFLALGVLATGAMFFIQQGAWLFALVAFALANIGLNGSFVFYDALLPHVAAPEDQDRVSSAGYAIGYLGSSLLLALGLALVTVPGRFGLPSGEGLTPAEQSLPSRITFVLAAIWWAVFSLPILRRVPEPPVAPRPPDAAGRGVLAATAAQLAVTFRELRRYRDALVFLIAFLIYNDGIGTIIRLATVYGSEIGIGRTTLIGAILITQLVGVPFAILFGQLAGRIGAKPAILLGITVYMGISIVGYFMRTDLHFLLLAILVGTVQGGTQALSRSLFASMIPKSKSGEFFGFYSVFEKGASILGPLVFWLVLEVSGSSRSGILALIAFFVAGGVLLLTVNVERGQAAARGGE
jgi:UMF1 family MFS transporter